MEKKAAMLSRSGARNQNDLFSLDLPAPAPSGRRHISTSRQGKSMPQPEMEESAASIAVNRCARILNESDKVKELTAAVNVLLVTSYQLEIQLDSDGEDKNMLLNGLVRHLEKCFPVEDDDDNEEEDKEKEVIYWEIYSTKERYNDLLSSAGTMALLTVLRNISNVATNRAIVANHLPTVRLVTKFIRPEFFALPSILLVADIAASIARYTELGGSYMAETVWLPVLSSSFVTALVGNENPLSREDRRWRCGLHGLASAYHKASRAIIYPDHINLEKRNTVIRLFSLVRLCLLYATEAEPFTFRLPSSPASTSEEDDVYEREEEEQEEQQTQYAFHRVKKTSPNKKRRRIYMATKLTHIGGLSTNEKRHLTMRTLEILSSIKNNLDYSVPLLISMPKDVIDVAVTRIYWRLPGSNKVDSEIRLAALELLALISEIRFPAEAPSIIAHHQLLIDVAFATLIVTHHKYAPRNLPPQQQSQLQIDLGSSSSSSLPQNHASGTVQSNTITHNTSAPFQLPDQTPPQSLHQIQLQQFQQQQQQVPTALDSSGGKALLGFNSSVHASIIHDWAHHSHHYTDDSPLIPLRSHRAETVRLITNILAGIYFHRDQKARTEFKKYAMNALAPLAANDDTIADLLFNRLSAPDDILI